MKLTLIALAFTLCLTTSLRCYSQESSKETTTLDLSVFDQYQVFTPGDTLSETRTIAGTKEPPLIFALPNAPLGKVQVRPDDKLSLVLAPASLPRGAEIIDLLDGIEDFRLISLHIRGASVTKDELSKLARFKNLKSIGFDCGNIDSARLVTLFPDLERLWLACLAPGAPEGTFPGDGFEGAALDSFVKLKKLKRLSWWNFQIDHEDVAQLATFDHLKSLFFFPLDGADDDDVLALAKMNGLVELDILIGPKCSVKSVLELQKIQSMKYLTIYTDEIRSPCARVEFKAPLEAHDWKDINAVIR